MNILLCSVPVERPGDPLRRARSEGTMPIMPKVAITSLNHWAEKNNYKTSYYDIDMLYPSDDEIKEYFKKNKPDVVGLSAVVSTSYLQTKRLSKIIKNESPETLIVCGGYLTAAAKTILMKTDVDVCVVGDGEIAWVGILDFIKKNIEKNNSSRNFDIDDFLKIKGIAILDNVTNEIRFSGYGHKLPSCEMVFPSFNYLKSGLLGNDDALKNYFRPFYNAEMMVMDDRAFEKGRRPMMASIFLTKGCVAKCTFCQRGSKGYQTYDLKKLEEHLKILRDEYNVGFLLVDDENFGSVKKYCYEAAELLNKYDMLWYAGGVRVTNVTKEDLLHYKNNGCISIKFGIESGSQTMLDIMEKKFTVEDIKRAILTCFEIDLYTSLQGFMLGMPGESKHTARMSGKLIGELSAELGVPVDLLYGNQDLLYTIPLVGTPMYEYGKLHNLIGNTVDDEEKYLELTSNVGAYKRYFINLNGAPMSEVVFWDFLVFLEATRTYRKLMKNKKENEQMKEKFKYQIRVKGMNPQVRAKEKEIRVMGAAGTKEEKSNISLQYLITNFLRQHIVFNQALSKLPRFFLEPFVQYLAYFEYLIQKHIFKDSNNLHTITNKESVRKKIRINVSDLDPNKTTQKDRSLRSIVKLKKEQLNIIATQSEAEKLVGGP